MEDDIRQWLEELGLGKYGDVFVENGIGVDVVADLDKDDLQQLGVNLGDSKRLLRAIAQLGSKEVAPASIQVAKDQDHRSTAAERRQLTVMFCDLVGSTELSRRLDPEDLRDIMARYQDAVASAVIRYEGHIAKFLGDGVLAYFGWPHAHEDQAARAVRAALDALTAVEKIKIVGETLRARVGIATGQVVVGDLVGDTASDLEAVSGETPNLAARLQGMALPGQVVINALTRQLIGMVFVLEDLGPHNLKGFEQSVPCWAVTGEGQAESRFDARHEETLTRFVGRKHELGLLTERWSQAKGGEGQVVLLAGGPGIGKSRLVRTLRDEILNETHFGLRYQCSPLHANTALYPIIQRLTRAARFSTEDDIDTKLDKLESLLRLSNANIASIAPIFATLLSLPAEDRYGSLELSPQLLRARTIEALVDQVTALSQLRPVLFVVEDAHWIDPTTKSLVAEIMAQVQGARVLVLITHRPERSDIWPDQPHLTSVALNRLSREQGAEIVHASGGEDLTSYIIERIVARADGVPLFVEALTQTVLDSGDIANMGNIPTTLQASLMASIDRLGSAKRLAQIGAVIGREFSHDLLAAITEQQELQLESDLEKLVRSGLVIRQGAATDRIYAFKQTLVQDAAYESLLISRRRELHRDIAETSERDFPEIFQTMPEVLAHHFSEAGQTDRAVFYWARAGNRAVERSANHEAIAHLERGLELVTALPEGLERDRSELDLRLMRGTVLLANKGYAAPEVTDAYTAARDLCQRVGTPEQQFAFTWGLWINAQQGARLVPAHGLSHELLEVAERQDKPILLLQARHSAWTSFLSTADFELCRQHSQRGHDDYDSAEHKTHVLLYGGHDPGVCASSHLMQSQWYLGHLEQAANSAQETLASAEKLGHPMTLILAHFFTSYYYLLCRDATVARQQAEICIALSQEHGVLNYGSLGNAVHGWATAVEGDLENGVAEISKGLAAWQRTGAGLRVPEFLAVLAEVQGWAGRPEQGLESITEALRLVEATGEKKCLAEIIRIKGGLLMLQPEENTDASEECFNLALKIARQQQAKMLELRAAVSLARIQAGTGRHDEARGVLSTIYEWFTEGLDTPDLRDAKALLDELK